MVEMADSNREAPAGSAVGRSSVPNQGFSFRQVQAFLALVHHGSFTKAAGEIHLTQSGLSRVIASLEREVGEPLFVRASNALRLSPAGKAFHPFAKRLSECYARTLTITRHGMTEKPSMACSCMVVPALLHCLNEIASGGNVPHLRINSMSSHKVLEAVRSGEADLGLCMVGVLPDDLRVEVIFNASLGLLANPAVRLPSSIERYEDLRSLPYARLADEMVLPAMLRRSRVQLPSYFSAELISDSMPSLMSAVASGHYVTLVSEVAAHHALATGLVFRPLPDLLPSMGLCILSRHTDEPIAATEWWQCLAHGLSLRWRSPDFA